MGGREGNGGNILSLMPTTLAHTVFCFCWCRHFPQYGLGAARECRLGKRPGSGFFRPAPPKAVWGVGDYWGNGRRCYKRRQDGSHMHKEEMGYVWFLDFYLTTIF
jgi:hypothetical protein